MDLVKTGLKQRIARVASGSIMGLLAIAGTLAAPATARADANDLESAFDRTLGTQPRAVQQGFVMPAPAPQVAQRAPTFAYSSNLEAQIAALASPDMGRIGVAAVDLSSGRNVAVLGDQPFPMASTSKVAIAATFLDGVDQGRWRLSDMYPLMVPLPSPKFAGAVAPVRAGDMLTAQSLIELSLTRSDNQATDALLAAVGGPQAVNRWLRRAGLAGIRIDRDIATLVRDDGAVDPATQIDMRDSATPLAMVRLLSGLYRGQWLSSESRMVLLGAMSRCETGKHRIPALLPEGARALHKTGTLSNTASDIGIIEAPDGRAYAVAIYVTGQSNKASRDSRIASLARAIYDGYQTDGQGSRHTASR
ncbi:MAG: serine hydrolase [Sphingomonadales bacterium]|nr:serine hydrolase [Sphingomonadales bacterium]